MAKFVYKAVDAKGKVIEGQIEAANEADLEARVTNMELDLVRFKTESKPLVALQSSKISSKELIIFTYHLEQLLKAGVPLVDALQDLRDSITHTAFKDVINDLIEAIGAGKTFSEALRAYPKIFGDVYINMVHVGENTGQLVRVLKDLTNMLRWQSDLISKAKRLVRYPAFIITVIVSVIAFLMVYLVPQLIPFIKMAGQEIPWHTQALIDTSHFFINYWYVILAAPFILFALIKGLSLYSPSFRFKLSGLTLKVPVIGAISYKVKIARFCNYFALMYASGITVLDAILLSKHVMNNLVLEHALDKAHEQISEGESISQSFANVGLFPALVVRMLKVGESTGAMSEALMSVSSFYEQDVTDAIEGIEPMIMPAITIMLGLFVGWIALSIMGPVYDAVVTLSAI